MDRMEYIVAITSKALDIPVERILSKRRLKTLTEARAIIVMIIRDEGATWQKISEVICREDHASACHSYKTGMKWLTVDKVFKKKYSKVKSLIDGSYEDYTDDDLRERVYLKIEACLIRVKDITKNLDKELTEITALKSELNK